MGEVGRIIGRPSVQSASRRLTGKLSVTYGRAMFRPLALAVVLAASLPAVAVAKGGPPPPDNIKLPSITGQELQGQTLTGDPGKWKRNPSDFDFQWLRCDDQGSNCVDIAGANGSTYVLTVDDAGATLRLEVTASNNRGEGAATSDATGPVAGLPPAITGAPSISGTPREGATLTADPGTWSNAPASFRYAWQRCSDASTCVDIAGAGGSTYVLDTGDVGFLVRVVVTGVSRWGETSAASQPTAAVSPAPPGGAYATAVRASGPTNFFRFENPDPADFTLFNEIRDELGSRNGETTIVPGRVGNALRLINNAAGFAGLVGGGLLPDMTVEFWIRPTTGGRVFSVRHAAFGDGPTMLLIDDGRLVFQDWSGRSPGGSIVQCDPGACNLLDGAWHHVAYTQSTALNESRYYLDGQLTSTTTGYFFPSPHSSGGWGSLLLGWDSYASSGFPTGINAEFDEFATYDHALTAAEIAAHHAAA
jgi:concanavalin A-like lectin/glucanase superfamily protein